MRRYNRPAEVVTDENGAPTRLTAWDKTLAVAEVLGPHWEHQEPWWIGPSAGQTVEELRVRHYRVRAHGPRREVVVELVQRAEGWFVVGVED